MNNESKALTHRELAASCFNRTWDYLDKPELSADEIDEMIHIAHASFWHWTQVEDHTSLNLSIGTWQLSRVYAVAGQPERAEHFAKRCVEVSETHDLPPFYVGYGYEACARASALRGERQNAMELIEKGRHLANLVEKEEDQRALLNDLDSIL